MSYAVNTHMHSILIFIGHFPGEPGLAGCPLNSSPYNLKLCIVLGQT